MQPLSSADKIFYRLAAIAAFITVGTNLYIHLTDFVADSFEERILLFRNKAYINNRLIIIVHCLLVIISTMGMGLVLQKQARGFASLGMLSFTVFGLTETVRMLFSLNYVNGLREKYFNETSSTLKELYAYSLNNAGLINNILFRLFIVAFALGLLCYGLALIKREMKADKIYGYITLFLSAITFTSFVNDFYQSPVAGSVVHWVSVTIQPLVRFWMGVWIINNAIKEGVR